ncbi:hypothetical protein PR048_004855 [Dryococelus australis]|uniref:Uncharacterized protein n=1 Tax=Dryococelus australis TaxID=614101 RepID=A0ABQ9I6L1_9NEOP|nr:hypothetical protein PR048_004855 [Dryococelus australis]
MNDQQLTWWLTLELAGPSTVPLPPGAGLGPWNMATCSQRASRPVCKERERTTTLQSCSDATLFHYNLENGLYYTLCDFGEWSNISTTQFVPHKLTDYKKAHWTEISDDFITMWYQDPSFL